MGGNSHNDDDANTWSIHNLHNAPEPPDDRRSLPPPVPPSSSPRNDRGSSSSRSLLGKKSKRRHSSGLASEPPPTLLGGPTTPGPSRRGGAARDRTWSAPMPPYYASSSYLLPPPALPSSASWDASPPRARHKRSNSRDLDVEDAGSATASPEPPPRLSRQLFRSSSSSFLQNAASSAAARYQRRSTSSFEISSSSLSGSGELPSQPLPRHLRSGSYDANATTTLSDSQRRLLVAAVSSSSASTASLQQPRPALQSHLSLPELRHNTTTDTNTTATSSSPQTTESNQNNTKPPLDDMLEQAEDEDLDRLLLFNNSSYNSLPDDNDPDTAEGDDDEDAEAPLEILSTDADEEEQAAYYFGAAAAPVVPEKKSGRKRLASDFSESRPQHEDPDDSDKDTSFGGTYEEDEEEGYDSSDNNLNDLQQQQQHQQGQQQQKEYHGNSWFFYLWICWTQKRPTLHQVASCVVLYAPCFWIGSSLSCLCKNNNKKQSASSSRRPTDRAILSRLNVLVAFFAAFQIGSAVFFGVITVAPNLVDRTVETQTPKEAEASQRFNVIVWNVPTAVFLLGAEAFCLVVAALLTVRVVRNVNLVGAIRYLWVLLWILPFEIFFNIYLYDYFRVTDVWLRHYWRDDTMGWFRETFCSPATANTLCAVPVGGNETEWCLDHYNSTSCSSIRNEAQRNTEAWLLAYYYFNASWGLVLICLLFLIVNTLEGIISKPLVQKSRQSNVPAWMSLPIVGCVVFGLVYSYAQTSGLSSRSADTDANWIGPLYLVTAGLFFLAAVLGWYISVSSITNTRHKRNKMIFVAVFIILMALIAGSLIALFAASVTFSSSFVKVPLTESQRGDLACFLDQAGTCTGCDEFDEGDPRRCPEWTVSDVTKVIQTQAKSSAALAAILMLYAFSAFRFGLGMRKHIQMYQIEYV